RRSVENPWALPRLADFPLCLPLPSRHNRTAPPTGPGRKVVMLRVLGRGSRLCDGLTRRELLRVGGLSLFGGLPPPRLLHAADATRQHARAKSVILSFLLDGPSHKNMFSYPRSLNRGPIEASSGLLPC